MICQPFQQPDPTNVKMDHDQRHEVDQPPFYYKSDENYIKIIYKSNFCFFYSINLIRMKQKNPKQIYLDAINEKFVDISQFRI